MSSKSDFTFQQAPELPGSDRFARVVLGLARSSTRRLWRFRIEGVEHVPAVGPAIITPNHLAFCDSVFVSAALPRRTWAIGKGEYLDRWTTKYTIPALGIIPVDRSGGDAAQAALDESARVLDSGNLFLVYPEGTRSRDGRLNKGRTGPARLAARCEAPVIPTGHTGTLDVQTPGSLVLKPFQTVTVRFGQPMWIQDHGDPDDPRTMREFTNAVMYEIATLSGQEYVDEYVGSTTSEPTTPAESRRPARVEAARPSIAGDAPSWVPLPRGGEQHP